MDAFEWFFVNPCEHRHALNTSFRRQPTKRMRVIYRTECTMHASRLVVQNRFIDLGILHRLISICSLLLPYVAHRRLMFSNTSVMAQRK